MTQHGKKYKNREEMTRQNVTCGEKRYSTAATRTGTVTEVLREYSCIVTYSILHKNLHARTLRQAYRNKHKPCKTHQQPCKIHGRTTRI